ncbi:MAG: prephenate dehydratase [Phascolarctobacterium sp.]|uniref:prephenate dehydratase n=1 Tax=Phascolarctobacterium sp. TaxID=2049039 RepID=UPI0026DDC855|nr:prephenate dehydratase [Phascolarctobacterium sp.]MDO4921643.1 prephenate dehydratase [Phascolarctobacterium sp.]
MQELDLELIRKEIDKADQQLAEVLEQRLQLVMQVAAYKKSKGMPVKDKNREAKVIAKVAGFLENQDYSIAVKNIMRGIIDQACVLEETAMSEASDRTFEVACFGPAGSFTHQALDEYFRGRKYNRHHYNTFEEVISSISDGSMDYAVLPIENSSTGGITEVYDLLRHYDCSIVGEQCVKIEQNLLGCAGATLGSIKTVYSHPQGFKQCKDFFRDYPDMEQVPYFSTSKSAEEVAAKQDITLGAVAGKAAADMYNLQIIAPAINSNSNNYTRFVIIARKPEIIPHANKITLIFAVKHETGSLYKILASFYHTGLNLTNLESRPTKGKPWEYFFYIDVTGNLSDPLVGDVMEEVKSKSTYLKILGNYRAYEKKE